MVKKLITVITLLTVCIATVNGQGKTRLINANPNPNGEPWIVGGFNESPEYLERLRNLPELDLSHRSSRLPDAVNNADHKFFRPIFNQQGGSCAQASGTAYNYTYEVNRAEDSDASKEENQYPSHWTWNFLNNGVGDGSDYLDGWDIIKDAGCPTVKDFGGITGGDGTDTKWMTGYSKYYNAMKSKKITYKRILINNEKGLEDLKKWLSDHGGDGKKGGGLACFSVLFVGADMKKLPSGSAEAGKSVVTKWGVDGGHAMTIVGYNDDIKWDYNGDGQFTNDKDINGDGKVDMRDWEIGGLLFANSHGTGYGDKGFAYMTYKVCADIGADGGITSDNMVSVMDVQEDYDPQVVYKLKIKHSSRSDLKIDVGINDDLSASQPKYTHSYNIFSFQGGKHPMQGIGKDEEIEIALDATPLLMFNSAQESKYFVSISSRSSKGKIVSFSLMDYRGKDLKETKCSKTNVDIKKGTNLLYIKHKAEEAALAITTDKLPRAEKGKDYSVTLEADGGKSPYKWKLKDGAYTESSLSKDFPKITKVITPNDTDDGLAEQELEFEFPFYGKKYKKVYMLTDGSLVMEGYFSYLRNRSGLLRRKAIAVLGGDMTYVQGSKDKMYYEGDKTKATFRWRTEHMWGDAGAVPVNFDFAVTIYPSGKIEMYYGKDFTKDIGSIIIGISGGLESGNYLPSIYNTSDITDNLAFQLNPVALPEGMKLSEDGKFSGKLEKSGTWKLTFVVTDANKDERVKTFSFTTENVGTKKLLTNSLNAGLSFVNINQNTVGVNFNTSVKGLVRLDVFNVAGRKVATLVNGEMKAGMHNTRWQNVTSGTYFFKLKIGNKVELKKMVKVK